MIRILTILLLTVSMSRPALAGGVGDVVFLVDTILFPVRMYQALTVKVKEPTVRFELGANEGAFLFHLSTRNLIGLTGSNLSHPYEQGELRGPMAYFVYRGYVSSYFYGELGIGGAQTQYESKDYSSETSWRSSGKITLGAEVKSGIFGIGVFASHHAFSKEAQSLYRGERIAQDMTEEELEIQRSRANSHAALQTVGLRFIVILGSTEKR